VPERQAALGGQDRDRVEHRSRRLGADDGQAALVQGRGDDVHVAFCRVRAHGGKLVGALHLEPYHAAWVRDLNAPFLFQTVEGDFDVRARVRVKGSAGGLPGGTWSLGGLMARVPNGLDAKSWEPRRENWHFITTGVALDRGAAVTETKGTYNSYSSLKLRPFQQGWVELRLVRVGMTLFALARPDGATAARHPPRSCERARARLP